MAFPELRGGDHLLQLVVDGEFDSDAIPPQVQVTIRSRRSSRDSVDQRAVLLTGRLQSPPYSVSERISFETTSWSGMKELDALSEEVARHPDWQEDELVDGLRRLQAEYPFDEKERFISHLDIARFAAVLGPIEKADVDFVWRKPEAPDIVSIRWRVEVETGGLDGRPGKYRMIFEPTHGRLVSADRER